MKRGAQVYGDRDAEEYVLEIKYFDVLMSNIFYQED